MKIFIMLLLAILLTDGYVCLAGRPLSRKRLRDVTTTDGKLAGSSDTSCPSVASESAADSRSPEHGLSLRSRTLRSRLRHIGALSQREDKQAETQGGSSGIFSRQSADNKGTEQPAGFGSVAAAACRGSEMVAHHSAMRRVITKDRDGAVMAVNLSHGKVTEPESLQTCVTLRRRLGMTSRTTSQPGVAKHHCQGHSVLREFPHPVDYGSSCTQSNTEDEVVASSSVSRSSPALDKSFTKLVVGLRQIPSCHQVSSKTAARTETPGIPRSHRRQRHQSSLEQIHHTHCRRWELDRDSSCNQVDGKLKEVDSEDDQCRVKDCVVVLQRSRTVEEMVKCSEYCPGSETETSSHIAASSHSSWTTSSSALSSSAALSSTTLSSPSSLLSVVSRNDDMRRKLSLRKFPRTDITSSSLEKNLCSNLASSGTEMTLPNEHTLAGNLSSVSHQNLHSSEMSACSKVEHIEGSKCFVSLLPLSELSSLSGEISVTARHRLKRRKVCLQLTGSTGSGSGLDREKVTPGCIVAQAVTDLTPGTPATTVIDQNQVMLPQPDPDLLSSAGMQSSSTANEAVMSHTEVMSRPDPDFLPSPTTVKRAKTSEGDLGQSEVIPQPDPDSRHYVESTDGTDCENIAFKGQAKVVLQADPNLLSLANCSKKTVVDHAVISQSKVTPRPDPDLSSLMPVIYVSTVDDETVVGQAGSDPDHLQPDPDYVQPVGSTDFLADSCTDAMYHMALFSSPETSDLDTSPPFPSSPTQTPLGDNQSSTGQQTTLYQRIDDDDDGDDDDEAVGYLSETKHKSPEASEPRMKLLGHLKRGILHRAGDRSMDVFRSASPEEIVSASCSELRDKDRVQEPLLVAEEPSKMMGKQAEESLSRFSEQLDIGKKDVGSTSSYDKSVRKMDSADKILSQPEHVNVDVIGHRKKDIVSKPSVEESVMMPDCDVVESSSKPENVRLDLNGHNGVGKNDIGLTPCDRLLTDESSTLVEASATTSDCSIEFKLARKSESIGTRKNDVGSTPREKISLGGAASVPVDSLADLVVLCPENPPPSRHEVMSDLASSCRSTLLQSTFDAFCSDAGDLPPRPR